MQQIIKFGLRLRAHRRLRQFLELKGPEMFWDQIHKIWLALQPLGYRTSFVVRPLTCGQQGLDFEELTVLLSFLPRYHRNIHQVASRID